MSASDDLHTKILSHGPSSDTLFILLTRMKKEGELRKVIQACVRALDMYPSDIRIRKLLAEAFLEAGFLSQAEEEMQKVTRQITELATIFKRKAEVLAKQQRSEEALEAAQTYLAHYPDDQDALRLLEDVSPPEEDSVEAPPEEPEEAETMPEEAEPIPETYPEPPEDVEAQTAPSEITPLLAEEEEPQTPSPDIATPTLAEVYVDQGQIEEAIKTYERVLEQNPDDEQSRERLQELQAEEAPAAVTEDAEDAVDDGIRAKKEKTEKVINTLESWLEDIQEMAKPPGPADMT